MPWSPRRASRDELPSRSSSVTGSTVSDASLHSVIAHEPEPDSQGTRTLLRVCPFILVTEVCERLAYYGLATNLVTYLTKVMGMPSAEAAAAVSAWSGVTYVTPILGAWIADSFWGRYLTILVFCGIYLVGLGLLVICSAVPGLTPPAGTLADAGQVAAFFIALYIISLGAGGIKPNVNTFGAEQFNLKDERDAKDKNSFFNWFYMAINVGSLIAATLIVYLQESVSWMLSFAIILGAMGVGTLIFVAGVKKYKRIEPTGSPIALLLRTIYRAVARRQATPEDVKEAIQREADRAGACGQRLTHTAASPWLDKALVPAATTLEAAEEGASSSKEDMSSDETMRITLRTVEDVKKVLRTLPTFLCSICFWMIYQQMSTYFVLQGAQMNRNLGAGITLPAASMSALDTIAILVIIPIYDRVVVPFLEKRNRKPTEMQRIMAGFFVAVLAMVAAAVVEICRMQYAAGGHYAPNSTPDPDTGAQPVDMSIWWQVPQYFFIGLSEVLASVGVMEFFYNVAPTSLRSCMMALYLLGSAFGSFFAAALVPIITAATVSDPWLPDNLDEGHLVNYFLLLGGLMVLNMFAFIFAIRSYNATSKHHHVHRDISKQGEKKYHQSTPQGGDDDRRDNSGSVSVSPARSTSSFSASPSVGVSHAEGRQGATYPLPALPISSGPTVSFASLGRENVDGGWVTTTSMAAGPVAEAVVISATQEGTVEPKQHPRSPPSRLVVPEVPTPRW